MNDRNTTRTLRPWVLISAAWIVPAILASLSSYFQARVGHWDVPGPRELIWQGGDWLLYGALTPLVFLLAHRYPLRRGLLARNIAIHFVAALLMCVAWAALGLILRRVMHLAPMAPTRSQAIIGWSLITLPFGVAVYFAVLGLEHAVSYFQEARDRETQAARLSTQLAEARLGALRMQMQPHFLLNSLNAITVIVRDRDTATATRMLEHLGEILRRVMRTDRPQEVTLAEELDFVRQYLAIEQVRFSDRLQPLIEVDPRLLTALVPEFLLQPLVENALRHGLAKRVTATLLRIEARREGDVLVLSVIDDGPGPGGTPADVIEGVGLGNTRERLVTLYGDRASVTLVGTPEGGAAATVRLPWHEPEQAGG
jgi:signal transduction histidine kinase